MSIPDDLRGAPLADMVLRAVVDPAAFVQRERRPDGRREPMADWRARAVWEAMEGCGIDPAREFISDDAKRAFDESSGFPPQFT